MSLKIEYSTPYELIEIFKTHPEDVAETDRLCANANKKVDDLSMELEIVTAEIIDEIINKRNVPPSAKQEVRRAEVQLDNRWQIKKKRLNKAVEQATILQGKSKGMFIRGRLLEIIGKIELRSLFGSPEVYYDNRNPETKVKDLVNHLDLPDE